MSKELVAWILWGISMVLAFVPGPVALALWGATLGGAVILWITS